MKYVILVSQTKHKPKLMAEEVQYNEDNIRSLDWKEHMRLRPGMYIGKTGDGSSQDDGIYILVKEVIDNCIDEFVMGYGKKVDVKVEEKKVYIRDYGRGIPLGKVVDAVSKINTGGKYDSKAFKKSVGLNGVGTKAVNALSIYFRVEAVREGKKKIAIFEQGNLIEERDEKTSEANGTFIEFVPDDIIFKKYKFIPDYLPKYPEMDRFGTKETFADAIKKAGFSKIIVKKLLEKIYKFYLSKKLM